MNSVLNPKIFNDTGVLYPDVRLRMLEIVSEFLSNVEGELIIPVLDIILVGSNANYNYKDTSDLDIHVVTDFEKISEDEYLASLWTNDERRLFNKDYDIRIKGISVELYVEDVNGPSPRSTGIYSILNNNWIKYPVSEDIPEFNIESSQYDYLLLSAEEMLNNPEVSYSTLDNFINDLYLLRKYSLMTDGEYGEGNLAFKDLRSRGILSQLSDKLKNIKSQQLSIEQVIIEEE